MGFLVLGFVLSAEAADPVRPAPIRPQPIRGAATKPATRSREQAVNLDALSETPSRPAATTGASVPAPSSANMPASPMNVPLGATGSDRSVSTGGLSPHKSSGSVLPNFKFYFDFLLKSWKGAGTSTTNSSDLTFDSYHQRVLVEFTPNPDLMFQADISSWAGQSPKYYEVDYMLTPKIQGRWGRIWIPFDDMAPHNIFGGRLNTSKFFQGNETSFLPDIWADMGMGLKFTLADTSGFASDLNVYVVNGFQDGGTSPVAGEGGSVTYPAFAGTSGASTDNNNAKGMGARWHSVMGRRFGLGASVYKDTYTGSLETDAKGLIIMGLDAQLRPTATTEIRVGYTTMKVDIGANHQVGLPITPDKSSFTRSATYVELGQKFGADDRWKFMLRAGSSQNDNRVVDVSDKSIVGFTLLKNFGSVEGQFSYSRDLHQVPSKFAYNYGAFRLVTAF